MQYAELTEMGFEPTTESCFVKRVTLGITEFSILYDAEDDIFEVLNLDDITEEWLDIKSYEDVLTLLETLKYEI